MHLRRRRPTQAPSLRRVVARVTVGGVVASEARLSTVLEHMAEARQLPPHLVGYFVLHDAGPPDGRVVVYFTDAND